MEDTGRESEKYGGYRKGYGGSGGDRKGGVRNVEDTGRRRVEVDDDTGRQRCGSGVYRKE